MSPVDDVHISVPLPAVSSYTQPVLTDGVDPFKNGTDGYTQEPEQLLWPSRGDHT